MIDDFSRRIRVGPSGALITYRKGPDDGRLVAMYEALNTVMPGAFTFVSRPENRKREWSVRIRPAR